MNRQLVQQISKLPFLRGLWVVNIIFGMVWGYFWLDQTRVKQQLSILQQTHHKRQSQQRFLDIFEQHGLSETLTIKDLRQEIKQRAKGHTIALKIKQTNVETHVLQLVLHANFWTEDDWFSWLKEVQNLPGVLGVMQMSFQRMSDRSTWPFIGEIVLLCMVS